MNKKFLILGGYGNTGRPIAELLLKETDVELILAGRDKEKAETLAKTLNEAFNVNRVSAMRVDAADSISLKNAFEKVDFVVTASSTIDYVQNVARAALEARIDYLDTQLSTEEKLTALRAMQNEIEQTGCCFITDCGFHPGIPAALVRHAGNYFENLEDANVGSVIKANWKEYSFSESTMVEMIDEFKHYRPIAYKKGEWKKLGWTDYKVFNFGKDTGKKYCVPMMMEEMSGLPDMFPSLKETGFFVSGFHWVTNYLVPCHNLH